MIVRLHLILDSSDTAVVDAIKRIKNIEIAQWDYSFDTAFEWMLHNESEKVDIIFASEYAQVSITDSSNKQMSRDTALLRRVKDLHLMRPQAKFILLCDEDRDLPENRHFLASLVAMGIYDFQTSTKLTEELLVKMIKEPKRDITHVQNYLPEVDDLKSWLSKSKSLADYNIKTNDVLVTDKIKVLLAAGENLADRIDNDEVKVVANIDLREKIIPAAEKLKPSVVIFSIYLRGSTDYLEVTEKLIAMNIRVIFLAGDLSPGSIEINKLKEMGVKEILYNPVDLGQLEKMIIRPDPSGEIVFKDPGKRGMFSAFLSQPSKIKTSGTPKAETSSIALFSKTVFIWSPVSSGKTTVALNLSAYAAKMGYQVALIDADPSCALHTYTKGVNDGQYLAEALLDDPYAVAHTITLIPELLIFTNDPNTDYPIITERNLRKLAGILEENNDLVVVDMPSNTGLMQKLPDVQILLVADQNWHHIKQIQRSLDEGWLPDNIKLVLNNYFDSGEIPVQAVEKALGQVSVTTIPSRTKELTEGIKTGIPAVLFDKPLLQGFSALIKEIKEG